MTIQNQARTYSFYTEEQMAEAQKRVNDPSLPAVIVDPSDPNKWAYYGQTDWMDETYKNAAPSYTVNFNIAQRTKKLAITFLANTTAKMVCSRKVTTSTTVTICVLK